MTAKWFNHQGRKKTVHRPLNPLPPMDESLTVDIKTGEVKWDFLEHSLGYVFEPSLYDQEGWRREKQMPLPLRANPAQAPVEFDHECFCESCFQNGRGEHELRVKGKEIYCPNCQIRRPLRNG